MHKTKELYITWCERAEIPSLARCSGQVFPLPQRVPSEEQNTSCWMQRRICRGPKMTPSVSRRLLGSSFSPSSLLQPPSRWDRAVLAGRGAARALHILPPREAVPAVSRSWEQNQGKSWLAAPPWDRGGDNPVTESAKDAAGLHQSTSDSVEFSAPSGKVRAQSRRGQPKEKCQKKGITQADCVMFCSIVSVFFSPNALVHAAHRSP